MPVISVIVPIYNAEAYLAECIKSIIQQTYNNLQIILVNDGSTDNSRTIAEQYARQDKRIELYSQVNKGQSAARNIGLQHATGDYISFIDADDYIDADFYTTLLHAFDINTDVVQIGYKRVYNGSVLSERLPHSFYQFTTPWMRLYRRNVLTQSNLHFMEGIIYEDVLFSIDLWVSHPKYKIVKYCGYNYTFNPHSTTSIQKKEAERILFTLLCKRFRAATDCSTRLLISYTYIRLKLHFLKI